RKPPSIHDGFAVRFFDGSTTVRRGEGSIGVSLLRPSALDARQETDRGGAQAPAQGEERGGSQILSRTKVTARLDFSALALCADTLWAMKR
ncbi:MAG: hypothetical protein H6R26_3322, partial [Proteobacteria bacterium]|nr:hypothetical protein [Pseudomonadota bacterium]